jgi:transposase
MSTTRSIAVSPPAGPGPALPPPRLRRPDRDWLLPARRIDDLLPEGHLARRVWDVVGRWDLSRFTRPLRARGSAPGRAATDPRLLVALWLYATTQNVQGGRALARLCDPHQGSLPYLWLAGGVSLNYHTLNAFRTGHGAALDDLLTQMLAALLAAGLVRIERVSQDGTRVRASAGSGSFRRRVSLGEALWQAQAHLESLNAQADEAGPSARRRAARRRGAKQALATRQQALEELALVEQAKALQKDKPSKRTEPRASTTDPQARLMRMADGGTRPAYNVQFAADTHSRAIVGVEVTNQGSDAGQDGPMRQAIQRRTGSKVKEQLTDGGYVRLEGIRQAAGEGVTVYMPLPKPRKEGVDPHKPKRGDGQAVAAWRARMGTEEAKAVYKQRAATSETVNAELKAYRGLGPLGVRGTAKVRCVALWAALAYNLVHFASALLAFT